MSRLSVQEIIKRVGEFDGWEDEETFMAFRAEMFEAYDALTEAEQDDVDESMVMEQIAMIASCYEEMDKTDGK